MALPTPAPEFIAKGVLTLLQHSREELDKALEQAENASNTPLVTAYWVAQAEVLQACIAELESMLMVG